MRGEKTLHTVFFVITRTLALVWTRNSLGQRFTKLNFNIYIELLFILIVNLLIKFKKSSKLSTTDLLVLASMKNAAKCDK